MHYRSGPRPVLPPTAPLSWHEAETLQRLIGEPDSSFATTDAPGEVGGAAAAVEMDDTLRSLLSQRGSRVDAENVQEAWAAAVAAPDDLDAIRAALPADQVRSWRQTYGTDAFSIAISFSFTPNPHRYPVSLPSAPTTRWHGTMIASGLSAHARAAARIARGRPMTTASWP